MRSVLKCHTAEIPLEDLPGAVQTDVAGATPISLSLSSSEPTLIAISTVMRALVETIPRIARQRTPVLIVGETGTGKTLLAYALHAAREHRKQPLVVVPCALLAEREEPTPGRRIVWGAIELEHTLASLSAHGGTLVLEELLDLSPTWQAKLCYMLERDWEGGAGGQRQKSRNVWVIATSCEDVAQAVHDQRLRADLYHRVCGILLVIPPLRERPEDISPLVQHVLAGVNAREGQSDTAFHPPPCVSCGTMRGPVACANCGTSWNTVCY